MDKEQSPQEDEKVEEPSSAEATEVSAPQVESVPEAPAEESPKEDMKPEAAATEDKEKGKPKKEKEEEIQEMTTLHERTIATLSYFGFLAIVPFYLKKESKYCRYHGKQGMTLAIIFFLAKLVAVLDIIMDLTLILQAIIALWMGFAALSGKWKRMPLIYNWSCQLEDALRLKTAEEEKDQVQLAPNQIKQEAVDATPTEDKTGK